MYIDTHSQESILASLSMLLSTSSDEITHFIISNRSKFVEDITFYTPSFEKTMLDFVYKKVTSLALIDEISFYHLGRRLNSDETTSGENLYTLLTTKNELSSFLLDHKIEFRPDKSGLYLYYKNNFVPLIKAPNDFVGSTSAYLKRRFGHSSIQDYCFNGFAFRDQLLKNTYAVNLYYGPEFLYVLAKFIRCPELITDFIKQSLYYCFEYRLPFEQFVFDEEDTLDSNAKLEYLLIKLFYRVYEHLTTPEKYIFDNDNPIIRLNDFDRMDARFYIGREEITEGMLGLGA